MDTPFIYKWYPLAIESLSKRLIKLVDEIILETMNNNSQNIEVNYKLIVYQIKDIICELKTTNNELLNHRMCYMFNTPNYKFDYAITMITTIIDNLLLCIHKTITKSNYKHMTTEMFNVVANRFKFEESFKNFDDYYKLLNKVDKLFYKRRMLKLPELMQALYPSSICIGLCFADYMVTITKYIKRFIDIATERLTNCQQLRNVLNKYENILANRLVTTLNTRSFLLCFDKYSRFSMDILKPRILVDLNECASEYKQANNHATFLDIAYSQTMCIICLERKFNHEFKISKDCAHAFCSTCTDNLIRSSIQQHHVNIFPCPMCRATLCANDSFYYINKTIPANYIGSEINGNLQCSQRQLNRSPWTVYSRSTFEKYQIGETIYKLSSSNCVFGEIISINFGPNVINISVN